MVTIPPGREKARLHTLAAPELSGVKLGGKLVLFRTGSEGSWKKPVCFKVCKGAGPKVFESGVEEEKDFVKAGKGGRVLMTGESQVIMF